ncbi:thioesterase family protein [Xylanibacter muris]|uniref:Thioesterase family protein n=1 Tax=Xylanibacter muris TaxID=2736290 RepID=A0ABX2AMR3_9BACT|nr:thioesterase family protein [Xylanibacter muris]NPD92494.1 thioesterase family protein [Xylanibacter muris]
MIKTGLTYTVRLVVNETNTAMALGSGDLPVFATPAMVAMMEKAAMLAVADSLPVGSTTVGGHIETSHIKPSPAGAEVTATATLDKVDERRLYFRLEARQGEMIIGKGTHLRFIVDRNGFMAGI